MYRLSPAVQADVRRALTSPRSARKFHKMDDRSVACIPRSSDAGLPNLDGCNDRGEQIGVCLPGRSGCIHSTDPEGDQASDQP